MQILHVLAQGGCRDVDGFTIVVAFDLFGEDDWLDNLLFEWVQLAVFPLGNRSFGCNFLVSKAVFVAAFNDSFELNQALFGYKNVIVGQQVRHVELPGTFCFYDLQVLGSAGKVLVDIFRSEEAELIVSEWLNNCFEQLGLGQFQSL